MGSDELLKAESQPSNVQDVSAGDEREQSLYNPGEDTLKANIKKLKRRGPFKSKWVLIGGVGGGGIGIVVLILVIITFLSSLLVPGLAQNILTYEFASVTRQFSQDTNAVLSENTAVNSVESSSGQAAVSKEFSDLNDGLFTDIKNLDPQEILDNLDQGGAVQFNYDQNSDGESYLKSETIDGQTVDIDPATQSFTGDVIHSTENFASDPQFGDDVSTAFQNAMPDNGVGVIIRGNVEQGIMDEINAPRVAFDNDKFTDDESQTQADQEEQVEAEEAINPSPEADVAGSIVNAEQNAITQGAQDEEAALTQATEDGVPKTIPPLLSNLASTLENNGFTDAIKLIDPAYAYLLPLCIVYDGSIQNTQDAQQTINVNSNEDQRTFFYIEAAADQQKSGDANEKAIGALNDKLDQGDQIEESIPMERQNGETVDTADVTVSPQTAGNGQYTAINAFAPSLAPLINPLATTVCPAITQPAVALSLGAATLAIWFTGPEGAAAADAAASSSTDTFLEASTSKALGLLDRFGVTENASSRGVALVSKLQDILPDKNDLAIVAGISGVDALVRVDTAMKMGELNDGFSQGTDLANQGDAGGMLNAGQDMQQQFMGVPLSPLQLVYNNLQNNKYIAAEYKSQSLYDRYISPSNPDSLVAKVGLDLYADFNKSSISNFISSIARMFSPSNLFSSVYNLLNPNAKVVADTVTADDQSDYGIVQWGYTNEEENLISSNPSYQPLENDEILSQYSTQVQAIEQTYGPCYTDTMAQLLTTMPTQGPDTSDYYITRNSNGDVTGGLCTDQYLGPDNTADPNAYDPSDSRGDLVFRWRLQQAYENTAQTLTGIANANSSSQ